MDQQLRNLEKKSLKIAQKTVDKKILKTATKQKKEHCCRQQMSSACLTSRVASSFLSRKKNCEQKLVLSFHTQMLLGCLFIKCFFANAWQICFSSKLLRTHVKFLSANIFYRFFINNFCFFNETTCLKIKDCCLRYEKQHL